MCLFRSYSLVEAVRPRKRRELYGEAQSSNDESRLFPRKMKKAALENDAGELRWLVEIGDCNHQNIKVPYCAVHVPC